MPDEAEAEVVRWMFAEAAIGKRPTEIAATANARQLLTKAKGSWSARQVISTLRNPAYIGQFRDDDSVRPGCHQPIIEIDQFEAAGRGVDSRRTARLKPISYGEVWPLKGMVICGRCRRHLSPHSCRSGNRIYRYYRCRATSGGRPACGYQITAWDIESGIAKRHPQAREGNPLDYSKLRQAVERVVYYPDTVRVFNRWNKDAI